MENKFIRVDEVADELGVSRPYAYIVIPHYLYLISLVMPPLP